MSLADLVADLTQHGHFSGTFDRSDLRRAVWSRDASHYRIVPEGTAKARTLRDISEILAAAHRRGIPVTLRSGGSSLSGQSVGDGLVVDVRSGFQKILSIEGDHVRVEPGVTLSRVNGHLLKHGRKLGPDPASMIVSTVGGAVANNSSGMSCGVEHNSYSTILSATIVLANGYVLDGSSPEAEAQLTRDHPEIIDGTVAIRDRLRRDSALSAEIRRLFTLKNTMGYSLQAFLDYDSPIDILVHLMVGSQGTLGFLADVSLRTLPVLRHTATTVLVFESLNQASARLVELSHCGASAIELLDSTSLQALNSEGLLPESLVPHVDGSSAAFLVDLEADSAEAVSALATRLSTLFADHVVVSEATGNERAALWKARKSVYAVVAKNRPEGTTALLEDVVVPTETVVHLCEELSQLCAAFGYQQPVFFGHVRDGNLHFMISDDFSKEEAITRLGEFTEAMADRVLALGGNLKAEHGAGRAMAPFVERQFGGELYGILREIKDLLDPRGILNPGVIFPLHSRSHLDHVKSVPPAHEVIDSCVECGFCESSCPSAGLTLSPRERIAAVRELGVDALLGQGPHGLENAYEVNQTCAVDGMCAVNCPVGINTGTLVKDIRARALTSPARRASLTLERHWRTVLTVGRTGLSLASRLPKVARAATRVARAVLPRGSFPLYDRTIPSKGFARSRLSQGGGEVVFLPSCMNSLFGESDLHEFLALATAHGVQIQVPQDIDDFCCGTPFSSKGLEDAATRRQTRTQNLLRSVEGKTVVIDGTSCHQTLLLGSTEDKDAIMDITTFIVGALAHVPVKRKLPRLVLHPTCSGEKTGTNDAMVALARQIADDVVFPVDWKCCGFAGDRGLLVPELTQHATRAEAEELMGIEGVRVTNNQPCGIALTQATGSPYRSIVSAWIEAVR